MFENLFKILLYHEYVTKYKSFSLEVAREIANQLPQQQFLMRWQHALFLHALSPVFAREI